MLTNINMSLKNVGFNEEMRLKTYVEMLANINVIRTLANIIISEIE